MRPADLIRWMSRWMKAATIALPLVLLLAACGGDAKPPTTSEASTTPVPEATASPTAEIPTPSTVPQTPTPTPPVAEIGLVEHPELGTILGDASGRIVYLSTDDERNTSNCSAECAEAPASPADIGGSHRP